MAFVLFQKTGSGMCFLFSSGVHVECLKVRQSETFPAGDNLLRRRSIIM